MPERASEIDFLRWFFSNTDFGPADFDVQCIMQDAFEEQTGQLVPEGYRIKDDEEEE